MPQISDDTSTREANSKPGTVAASELYAKFQEATELPEVGKRATNIPKFLSNLTIGLLMDGHSQVDSGRYARWMTSLAKRFAGNRHHGRSRFTLMEVLCDEPTDCEERCSWKRLHREMLKQQLATNRSELILQNVVIHRENKLDYLYYCKIYEWRLSDQALLNHIK